MNKKAIYVIAILLLAFSVTGCGIFQKKLPVITLTMADHNKTHTFLKGQKVEIAIAAIDYEWFMFVPEPRVFRQVIDAKTLPGIQGVYLAHNPGQTQLEARGEPVCKLQQTSCNKQDIYFKIDVIVEENL